MALARVTLWMGHKLAVDELGLAESTLPLGDLSGIQIGDALRIDWPRADAIIGNPPFDGDRHLRRNLGDAYVEWLQDTFQVGVRDYCVYWFRKAHDRLGDGARAGLVGTNSISQNRARDASLGYIAANDGVIVSAVSSQDWPGQAAVDVSIVNWVKSPQAPAASFQLDGIDVPGITTALRSSGVPAVETAHRLAANRGIAFQGMLPGADYIVDDASASRLRAIPTPPYSDVIRPYLSGDDIAARIDQGPSRFIVDFSSWPLEEAMRYPEALAIVSSQARAAREASRSYGRNPRWWQFLWPRPVFRERAQDLPRFMAGTATGKRILFAWCSPEVVASNSTNIFALGDDFAFGVLSSRAHGEWARAQSSTLEDRIRYTPSSAFETFPWPDASQQSRDEVASAANRLLDLRQTLCAEQEIGLTRLYNAVDDGAFSALTDAHRRLDEAVAAAYRWPREIAQDSDETNRRLLELNREISDGRRSYDPFAYLR